MTFELNQTEPMPVTEEELQTRFEPQHITQLARDYLSNGPFGDLHEAIIGKQFAIGIVDATDPQFGDLGKSLETDIFAARFGRSKAEVFNEYSEYDEASKFLIVLDVLDPQQPKMAGTIRMIENSPKGLKSVNDFVKDDPENPWREELGKMLFGSAEAYDPQEAWSRICARQDVSLDPAESLDIATLAVAPGYSSNGSLDGVSIRLYHSCLRYALAHGMKNLISIQDLKPLSILQSFGRPFDTFDDVQPHPYGGPYDTLPAFCVLEEGMGRIRQANEMVGHIFIDGQGMDQDTLRLQDLSPGIYGDVPTGLTVASQQAA